MAGTGQEAPNDRCGEDHLSHVEISALGLRIFAEKGEVEPEDEARGKIFPLVDPDEPNGRLVRLTETTGQQTTLS